MPSTRLRAVTLAGIVVFAGAAIAAQPSSQHWTQWGGPTRDFMVTTTGLANSWPAAGPKRLWTRALGEGHSAILEERPALHDVPAARRDVDGAAQPGRSGHRARCGVGQDDVTHKTDYGLNISTPIWSPADRLLIFSSAYGTGSRALELRQSGGVTTVVEKWALGRVRAHIGSIIRIGDMAYMSSGDFGPSFLSAVNVKTGAMAWQDRAFARAQLLYADNKLVVLDEDGTLVGRTIYVRDRKTIAAYDLS